MPNRRRNTTSSTRATSSHGSKANETNEADEVPPALPALQGHLVAHEESQGSADIRRSIFEPLAKLLPTVENFSNDTEQDAVEWLSMFELWTQMSNLTKPEKCIFLLARLQGPAKDWQNTLTDEIRMNWDVLLPQFKAAFLGDENKQRYSRLLKERRQGEDEPVMAYYWAMLKLIKRSNPNMDEQSKIACFSDGL